MKEMTVKSIPVKQVVEDIAKELNAKTTEHCSFYRLEVPERWGRGWIEGTDLDDGFGMLNYQCAFNVDLKISFTIDQVHPLKFLNCTTGQLTHSFAKEGQMNKVDRFENIIVGSEHHNGHELYFQADAQTDVCSIEIDRRPFYDRYACLLEGVDNPIVSAIKDKEAKQQFYYHGNYSLHIADIIDKLDKYKNRPHLQAFFYRALSFEMLVEHWQQYEYDQENNGNRYLLRKSEVKVFEELIDQLENQLDQTWSLEMIEQRFNISRKKVQVLFNEFYGTTFNSYLQELRLLQAVTMLENPEYQISEIMYALGWSSKSYFSKIFKRKYGITPSAYRKNKWDK